MFLLFLLPINDITRSLLHLLQEQLLNEQGLLGLGAVGGGTQGQAFRVKCLFTHVLGLGVELSCQLLDLELLLKVVIVHSLQGPSKRALGLVGRRLGVRTVTCLRVGVRELLNIISSNRRFVFRIRLARERARFRAV